MCLTIPGKVAQIKEGKFLIDYGSEMREVETNLVDDLKVGDYVMVANGIIFARVEPEKAVKFLEISNG